MPVLVNRPVDGGPPPLQTDIGLINAPFCADWSPVGTCSFAEQWQEALDPTVDGAAVNVEASLGKLLDHVSVAQAGADVPAHSQGNHIIRKAMM